MTTHNDRAREDAQAQEHHAHVDQYAQIAHELPESTAEALSRTIIRVVPLAYGVLFGLLIDRLWLGLLAGGLLASGLDLYMRDRSVVRAVYHWLRMHLCPAFAVGVQGLLRLAARAGLERARLARGIRCGLDAS